MTNTPITANNNRDCKVCRLVLWHTVTIRAVCQMPLPSIHLCKGERSRQQEVAKWPMKALGTAPARQYDYMTHGSGLTRPNETHPTAGDYWGPLFVSVCVCICVFISVECVFQCTFASIYRLL